MIRVRPGIVLTHVCDQSILVAAYEARSYCPYTTILNDTGEAVWKCLEEGRSLSDIVEYVKESFDIPPETDIEGAIMEYIEQLHSNGYVLYEEETET